ncbi:MAG TPA: membrane protein insertase YidC [Sphingomonadaceae bacterium]
MDNQRNFITFLVLSALLLIGWQFFSSWYFPTPKPVETHAAAPAAQETTKPRPNQEGGLQDAGQIAAEKRELATALAEPGRIRIMAPKLAGSINPVGAQLDDLTLTAHRETVAKDSPPVRLFSPAGTPAQYFTQFGFLGEGVKVPDANTRWQASGNLLAPNQPVTLSWDNGQGQTFRMTFAIDAQYMLTVQQSVENHASAPVVVRPFAFVSRTSTTASIDTWNVHSGPIGAFDGSVNFGTNYKDIGAEPVKTEGRTDWIGFTDIYWLSALIPQKGSNPESEFRGLGNDRFRADVIYQPVTVPAGQAVTRDTKLFAGAKESQVLGAYQDAGIPNFSRAIDWGWFELLEKPILWLLRELFHLVGNLGVAIMLLTLIVRGAMFPIAQKQFASMAAMRAIQPKMKAIQERYKDDKMKAQQEVAALYKAEGVNPLAGCLPLFLQIPIFFALYKVLRISIEMRHQPFFGWIKDLSAPDPLHILNLFGLLHWTPPAMLAIGPLALLLGLTMFLQFKLNPAQMDPTQQQMFMIMPWVMMFVMAPYAAGLLIYWCTSNLLTITQQAYLYSRHPQLRAQTDKAKADGDRAKARGKKG